MSPRQGLTSLCSRISLTEGFHFRQGHTHLHFQNILHTDKGANDAVTHSCGAVSIPEAISMAPHMLTSIHGTSYWTAIQIFDYLLLVDLTT